MKIQEINSYLVVFHKDRILLLKRTNDFWEFPGGGVDWGEDPRDAAIRETKEETGLIAENTEFLTVTSATYKKNDDDKHSIYLVYKGEARTDRVVLSGEHLEYRWVNPEEAKFMRIALNAEPVLDRL